MQDWSISWEDVVVCQAARSRLFWGEWGYSHCWWEPAQKLFLPSSSLPMLWGSENVNYEAPAHPESLRWKQALSVKSNRCLAPGVGGLGSARSAWRWIINPDTLAWNAGPRKSWNIPDHPRLKPAAPRGSQPAYRWVSKFNNLKVRCDTESSSSSRFPSGAEIQAQFAHRGDGSAPHDFGPCLPLL